MNEKCPSCGNIVEGKKKATIGRKMTRGAVKKGATMATGAAIGSVIPGIGTAAGAVVGLIASEFLNETADDIYDASVDKIEYEFSCPKCGKRWTKKVNSNQQVQSNASRSNYNNTSNRSSSSHSNTYSQSTTMVYDNTDWQQVFNNEFDFYFETSDKILSSKDSVLQYVYDLEYKFAACKNDVIYSEFHFLRAFACLQFSLDNSEDKSLVSHGQNFISIALKYLDDEEYKLVSLLFEILAVDTKNGNAPSKIKKLQECCPNISAMENTLMQTEYWRHIYNDTCFNQLLDTVIYFEEQNKEGVVIDALQRISELSDIGYNIYAYNFLFGYCVETDTNKCFEYAQKAVSLADFEKDFNKENPMHVNWLDCVNQLGYCYENGVGTGVNYDKAFELYQKCAKLGLPLGMANLAECYEFGKGVEQNETIALCYYNDAVAAGYENAEKHLKRILEKLGVETYSHGPYVPQKENFYMDIEDVFDIEERGVVITGQIKTGCINVGDMVIVTKKGNKSVVICEVVGIEMFRKLLDYAEFGDNVGLLVKGLENNSEIAKGGFVQYYIADKCIESKSKEIYTAAENEYLDELKACLEEDGEISPKERRLLERLREKLGISSERATELEATLSAPQLTDEEKEYLEEYKACFEEDEEISPKERRLLNRLRDTLGISAERAEELEKLSKKH